MRYLIKDETLTGIGNAIREKTGEEELIPVPEMAERIRSIDTSEEPVLEGVTLTPTGTEFVTVPPEGVDGFSIVTVKGDDFLLPENIMEGVTIYGVEGTLPLDMELQPVVEVTSSDKDVEVLPDEEYDGFASVMVKGDANLVPENIVEGVSIFGVEGTAKGGTTTVTNDKLPLIFGDSIRFEGVVLPGAELIFEKKEGEGA